MIKFLAKVLNYVAALLVVAMNCWSLHLGVGLFLPHLWWAYVLLSLWLIALQAVFVHALLTPLAKKGEKVSTGGKEKPWYRPTSSSQPPSQPPVPLHLRNLVYQPEPTAVLDIEKFLKGGSMRKPQKSKPTSKKSPRK